MIFGAHNSIAGGLTNAIAEAQEVAGECMQMFCKNQRQWTAAPLTETDATAFRAARAEAGIGPVLVHDSYLINMGNPDPEKAERSYDAFVDELQRCEALGVAFLCFHPGSHMVKGAGNRDDARVRRDCLERIAANVARAHDEVPGSVRLLFENAAGQGTNVGSSWDELAVLLEATAVPQRTGLCIDTQHSWAAGYDWRGDYDGVWDAFDDAVGRRHIAAFHLNDSKEDRGARVDRHENLGKGALGEAFWQRLVRDPKNAGLPGYLETPRPQDSLQVWADELAWLRGFRDAP